MVGRDRHSVVGWSTPTPLDRHRYLSLWSRGAPPTHIGSSGRHHRWHAWWAIMRVRIAHHLLRCNSPQQTRDHQYCAERPPRAGPAWTRWPWQHFRWIRNANVLEVPNRGIGPAGGSMDPAIVFRDIWFGGFNGSGTGHNTTNRGTRGLLRQEKLRFPIPPKREASDGTLGPPVVFKNISFYPSLCARSGNTPA